MNRCIYLVLGVYLSCTCSEYQLNIKFSNAVFIILEGTLFILNSNTIQSSTVEINNDFLNLMPLANLEAK